MSRRDSTQGKLTVRDLGRGIKPACERNSFRLTQLQNLTYKRLIVTSLSLGQISFRRTPALIWTACDASVIYRMNRCIEIQVNNIFKLT